MWCYRGLVLGIAALSALPADAVETPKWDMQIGGYNPVYKTQLNLRSNSNTLVGVNLEDVLKLDSVTNVVRFDVGYRLSSKDSLRMTFFNARRRSVLALQEDVTIGNTTFPAGAGVTTRVTTDEVQLKYLRRLYGKGAFSSSWTLGAHLIKFGASVKTNSGTPIATSSTISAPLPMLGLHASYRFGPSWIGVGSLEWLSAKIGGVNGRIIDQRVAVLYSERSGWGGGLAYNIFEVRVRAGESRLNGEVRYAYRGPYLFASYMF